MATKQDQVNEIVAANKDKTRKEVIALIRAATNMTDAGASTYYYNATKALAKLAKTNEINESLKATVAAEQTEAPTETAATAEPEVAAEPKAFQKGWVNDWTKRQKVAKAELEEQLKKINLDDIPAFLRKGK